MELEVTPSAVLVIVFFLLRYCTPPNHRVEDVVAHVLWHRRGLNMFVCCVADCCELSVSAVFGRRQR
jgi:hypothetical protein